MKLEHQTEAEAKVGTISSLHSKNKAFFVFLQVERSNNNKKGFVVEIL